MRVKLKKSLKDNEVLDVNGSVRLESKCVKQSKVTGFDTIKTIYIPIISENTHPENEQFTYYVSMSSGELRKSGIEVEFVDSIQRWVDKRRYNVVKGYFRFENNAKLGKILHEEFKTVQLKLPKTNTQCYCESDELAVELGFVPSKCSELYVHQTDEIKSTFMEHMKKSPYQLSIRTTHYADNNNPAYVAIKELYKNAQYKASKDAKFYARLLGDKTFGLEYETTQGNINPGRLGKLGIVPLIDGSIGRENYEYTSVIMEGPKGAMAIKEQCLQLTEYSGVNTNCAFHVHVGNVSQDRLTFVALFALCSRIENEMYSLFPYYKQHEVAVMGKQKEYSRKLPYLGIDSNEIFSQGNYEEQLNDWNQRIFSFFSCEDMGHIYNRKNRKRGHSVTRWREKWHCPTRYYWANFINYLFNSSGTVEFRIHEPTVNFTKVAAFVLLVSAIVRYAEKYPKKILMYKDKIRLSDIVEELRTNFGEIGNNVSSPFSMYANSVTDYLQEYIQERKNIFIRETVAANKQAIENQGNSFSIYQKLAANFIKADEKFYFKSRDGRFTLY